MPFDTFHVGAVDVDGTILRAVRNTIEALNHTLIRVWHSGRIQPIYSATGQIAPSLTFDTPEIGNGLEALTEEGLELSVASGNDLVAYLTRRNPVRVSPNADHLKTTIYRGVAVPRTLSWDGGAGIWMLSTEVGPESVDGLASPFSPGVDQLPALDVIPETYTGGKMIFTVDGDEEELECWQNASFDFGYTIDKVFHKGLPAPVRCAVQRGQPSLRFTNLDPTQRELLNSFGSRLDSAKLFLRRNQTTAGETPTRFADNSPAHVSIEFFGGIVHPTNTNAPEEGNTTQDIVYIFDEVPAQGLAFLFNTGVQID